MVTIGLKRNSQYYKTQQMMVTYIHQPLAATKRSTRAVTVHAQRQAPVGGCESFL